MTEYDAWKSLEKGSRSVPKRPPMKDEGEGGLASLLLHVVGFVSFAVLVAAMVRAC